MEYGFVYIWYDRKHKRYYIGAHWGTEDDGYICSSPWMKQAYRKRQCDFKRRVLARINTNKKDMFDEEAKWQSLIKDDELRTRYYNIKRHGDAHWSTNEQKSLTIRQKISKANKGRSGYWLGKEKTKEHKQKISNKLKGRPLGYVRSADTRDKISNNNKRLQAEGKIGMKGKRHSNETREKMSANNAMNSQTNRDKIGAANRGKVGLWLNNQKKMAKPGTELYDSLFAMGYRPKKELM